MPSNEIIDVTPKRLRALAAKRNKPKETKRYLENKRDPFENYSPMTQEEAIERGVMHHELEQEKHRLKSQFNKGMKMAVKQARKKLKPSGRIRLNVAERDKILKEQWKAVYGKSPPNREFYEMQSKAGVIGIDPLRRSLETYKWDDLDQDFPLDPASGAQSNRRFKIKGEVKNFPVAAIGYDPETLEEYADILRDGGFLVRKLSVGYDSTTAAKRWALFVHPKDTSRTKPETTAAKLLKLYESDSSHPQFGAKLRKALIDDKTFEPYHQQQNSHVILEDLSARWDTIYGDGPVATNVRLFNRKADANKRQGGLRMTDKKYNKMWQGRNEGFEFGGHAITDPFTDETGRFKVDPNTYYAEAFHDWLRLMADNGMNSGDIAQHLAEVQLRGDGLDPANFNMKHVKAEPANELEGLKFSDLTPSHLAGRVLPRLADGAPEPIATEYTLHSIPVEASNIVGPMNDNDESPSGLGIDERAGEVYDLSDAYVVVNEFNNRGRLEQITMGVYATEEDALRSFNNSVYDGEMLIHELPGADVLDFYRRWPYYFRQNGAQWLKKGINGENVKFESIGFTPASLPRTMTRNWLENSLEAEQSLEGEAGPISNAAYFRRLSGKTFRGVGGNLSKNHARSVAKNMRHVGFNARVIPNAKGHRVYLSRKG